MDLTRSDPFRLVVVLEARRRQSGGMDLTRDDPFRLVVALEAC
jgi:hypothetical protein